MIEILHDFIYQNPRNCGSIVYFGSCRISIINSSIGFYAQQDGTGQIPLVPDAPPSQPHPGVQNKRLGKLAWNLNEEGPFKEESCLYRPLFRFHVSFAGRTNKQERETQTSAGGGLEASETVQYQDMEEASHSLLT